MLFSVAFFGLSHVDTVSSGTLDSEVAISVSVVAHVLETVTEVFPNQMDGETIAIDEAAILLIAPIACTISTIPHPLA